MEDVICVVSIYRYGKGDSRKKKPDDKILSDSLTKAVSAINSYYAYIFEDGPFTEEDFGVLFSRKDYTYIFKYEICNDI